MKSQSPTMPQNLLYFITPNTQGVPRPLLATHQQSEKNMAATFFCDWDIPMILPQFPRLPVVI